mmetsp:Transcript_25745/g.84911  ORF Transcript_25745/g.84911 Transcript_25745/m.84911 type:complete len:278 (-) Transcript_25745:42-875(-)
MRGRSFGRKKPTSCSSLSSCSIKLPLGFRCSSSAKDRNVLICRWLLLLASTSLVSSERRGFISSLRSCSFLFASPRANCRSMAFLCASSTRSFSLWSSSSLVLRACCRCDALRTMSWRNFFCDKKVLLSLRRLSFSLETFSNSFCSLVRFLRVKSRMSRARSPACKLEASWAARSDAICCCLAWERAWLSREISASYSLKTSSCPPSLMASLSLRFSSMTSCLSSTSLISCRVMNSSLSRTSCSSSRDEKFACFAILCTISAYWWSMSSRCMLSLTS